MVVGSVTGGVVVGSMTGGGGGSRGPVTFWFVDIFRSLSLSKGGVRRVGLHFDRLSDRWWGLSDRWWWLSDRWWLSGRWWWLSDR